MIEKTLHVNISNIAYLTSNDEKAPSYSHPYEKEPIISHGWRRYDWRSLQYSISGILVLITIQGLVGNYVNLFAVFPTGSVSTSLGGLAKAVQQAGISTTFHAALGFWILAPSVFVLVISLRQKLSSIRITSIVAFFFVIIAVSGGLLFVFSGFTANGNSAQMFTGFIIAYAFYFLELYFTNGLGHPNRNVGVISQEVR
jgi:glucan phosphoethanolaminetransferase (alkaline phosphatase superfamily)